eukprot:1137947-Pelagomonas_calceolata.AAC.15
MALKQPWQKVRTMEHPTLHSEQAVGAATCASQCEPFGTRRVQTRTLCRMHDTTAANRPARIQLPSTFLHIDLSPPSIRLPPYSSHAALAPLAMPTCRTPLSSVAL